MASEEADIVERLRGLASYLCRTELAAEVAVGNVCDEAAAEIERLRAEVAKRDDRIAVLAGEKVREAADAPEPIPFALKLTKD